MMKINLLAGMVGAFLTLTPLGVAQQLTDNDWKVSHNKESGVQQAVAFQRAKDRADARQAKLEQRHPSIDYSNADRAMDDSNDGHHVTDPGPGPKKKD